MAGTLTTKPKRKTAADYEATATQLLAEMDRLEEQMSDRHAEGERLKAETQIIKARTEVKLSRIQEQINSLSRAT